MTKSASRGKSTSVVEVLNISAWGIWILVEDVEYFISFEEFPWFAEAKIADILLVSYPHSGHLYWAKLDIDLALDSLVDPEKFPLKAKVNKGTKKVSKAK